MKTLGLVLSLPFRRFSKNEIDMVSYFVSFKILRLKVT